MSTFRPDDHSRPTDPAEAQARAAVVRTLTVLVGAMAGALVVMGVVLAVIGAEVGA